MIVRLGQEAKRQIARLAPDRKKRVRATLRELGEGEVKGKALRRELTGYLSLEIRPLRIIYWVAGSVIHVDEVELRETVYEGLAHRQAERRRNDQGTMSGSE